MATLRKIVQETMGNSLVENKRAFRFDVFKGAKDGEGKVHRIKSVGAAFLVEGYKNYNLYLKTFLNEVFYLFPQEKSRGDSDYVILTREPSKNANRKYFWNNVGQGEIMSGENSGLVHLDWDVLGSEDLYLNLYPKNDSADSEVKEVA